MPAPRQALDPPVVQFALWGPACGTAQGYAWHIRHGLVTCYPCMTANTLDKRAARAAARAGAPRRRPQLAACGTEAAARRHRLAGGSWRDCPDCSRAGITWA